MTHRILVADDDEALRNALGRALRLEGYEVTLAEDGGQAVERLGAARPDLVVLDVLMPVLDGLAVCRLIRRMDDAPPVLLLTARDAVSDRVLGLDAGADDYLTKPFALEELLARLRAIIRRSVPGTDDVLSFGDLELNRATRRVRRGDRDIALTPTEFSLLELLLRDPGMVLTRSVISDRIWGYDMPPGSNTIDVFISCLRRKTEAGGEPRVIHTVRGVGFVLRDR